MQQERLQVRQERQERQPEQPHPSQEQQEQQLQEQEQQELVLEQQLQEQVLERRLLLSCRKRTMKWLTERRVGWNVSLVFPFYKVMEKSDQSAQLYSHAIPTDPRILTKSRNIASPFICKD